MHRAWTSYGGNANCVVGEILRVSTTCSALARTCSGGKFFCHMSSVVRPLQVLTVCKSWVVVRIEWMTAPRRWYPYLETPPLVSLLSNLVSSLQCLTYGSVSFEGALSGTTGHRRGTKCQHGPKHGTRSGGGVQWDWNAVIVCTALFPHQYSHANHKFFNIFRETLLSICIETLHERKRNMCGVIVNL